MEPNTIENINNNHYRHGYNQVSFIGLGWFRCIYKNGLEIGYGEVHHPFNSGLTRFYIR